MLLNVYYSTLFYKSTLVKSFQFSVLNFTVISLPTCPLSFVMIYRMQIKKERKKERLGILIIGYKDSFEIHIESKMNRCTPRIFHWQMGGLALRLYIIYVQF